MAALLEAFPGRLPSEIDAEMRRQPVGYLEEVLEARGYMKAKRFYDGVKKQEDMPTDWPMLDTVREISFQIAGEELEKRRG